MTVKERRNLSNVIYRLETGTRFPLPPPLVLCQLGKAAEILIYRALDSKGALSHRVNTEVDWSLIDWLSGSTLIQPLGPFHLPTLSTLFRLVPLIVAGWLTVATGAMCFHF